MARQQAGGARGRRGRIHIPGGVRTERHPGDVRGADGAGPQHHRRTAGEINNGRLDADPAGPAVQDQRQGITKFVPHMRGSGGAEVAEAVGRRRRDAAAECPQQGQRHRVVGHAQGHRVLPAGDRPGHPRAAGEDHRQRTRPEGLRQCPGGWRHVGGPLFERLIGRQVDDQRMVGRPALEGKDARHRGWIQGIGAQAVDGLGGQRHHLPGAQQGDCLGDHGVDHGVSRSMCAARMKSLRLRPPTEWVHRVISTRPQASSRSGW